VNFSKQVSPIWGYAAGSVITALALLGPAVALLMFIATEVLIDLLLQAVVSGVCMIAAGAIGLVLSRNSPDFVERRSTRW
jgi:hypothetical protein